MKYEPEEATQAYQIQDVFFLLVQTSTLQFHHFKEATDSKKKLLHFASSFTLIMQNDLCKLLFNIGATMSLMYTQELHTCKMTPTITYHPRVV